VKAGAALLVIALLAGCAGGEGPGEDGSDLECLLPAASELEGWSVVEGPVTHAPETLYEYIDGAADRYLTHGFRALLHVRYQLGEDPLASVTLDLYDMGSDLGAFGIYSAGRWPEVEVEPWGAEGYREGTVAAAWKGCLFVRGEADDERPELIALLERLVAGAADGVAGEPSPPAILAALPEENRVPRSERCLPENLLGHVFLSGGVTAIYEIEGRRAELFFSLLEDATDAGEALEALGDHLGRRGRLDGDLPSIGGGGFRYTEPTLGSGSVVRSGAYVAGIHGEMSAKERERLLARLVDGLR
jgi:hypothetical protein